MTAPVVLDMEVGEFFAKAIQHSGKVCKPVTNDKVRTFIATIITIITIIMCYKQGNGL